MLDVGDRAPDFELTDQQGRPQSLSRWLTQRPVVLYFYPADFTPVCTAQACAFRDVSDSIVDAGVQLVGISPQTDASHARFTERFELPFPILYDPGKRVIDAYGVNGPLGFGVRRATFYIGRSGAIERRVVSDLFVGSHTAFIEQILKDAPA